MKRDLNTLASNEYDVLIIGGGIFGACAAWDATLRGLSVALIEAGDFCGGTSANSFKMVHGGVRYLQHLDLYRLRTSCHERSAFLRIAPHLVQPLPIVIPTYGYGKSGKLFLGAGMLAYDLLTLDRNRGIKDPKRKIPPARYLSRQEVIDLFPGIHEKGLTGGVVFCDGQMYNPTRLVLSFLQSAVASGATIANYVEATDFIRKGNSISGISARDALTNESFDIRGKVVLNAAGPWAEDLLNRSIGAQLKPAGTYSRDACFLINRRFRSEFALAVQGRTKDPNAILSRSARHLFVVPWRNYSLVGVWHVVHKGKPDSFTVTTEDLQGFINEINWAYPDFNLSLDDVTLWNAGLVPFGENEPDAVNLSYGKRSYLIDHKKTGGIDNLVSLIGIRYTMGRGDAAQAVDIVSSKLGLEVKRPRTDWLPIHGGDIENFDQYIDNACKKHKIGISKERMRALIHNHGSAYEKVLDYLGNDHSLAEPLGKTTVLKAEVLNAIHNEMALKLADVVFRRTDLATGGDPGENALQDCAALVASELGWDPEKTSRELTDVYARFPRLD